jgi:ABC-2 type transport system permease protein
MYFRNFTAVFFTFIFPIIFLVVFGFISTGNDLKLSVAVFNDSKTPLSSQLEQAITNVPIFELTDEYTNQDEARAAIKDEKLNYMILIPENFGTPNNKQIPQGTLGLVINETATDLNQSFQSIIDDILNGINAGINKQVTGVDPINPIIVEVEGVQSEDLGTINYLVPGIIGFSIMSLGVFSVSNAFVSYKSSGSLRRLFVTPVGPFSFIAGQSVARLIMTVLNVMTMLVIGSIFFNFELLGNLLVFLLVSILGAIMFLGFGFTIAGWAKDENQAAPISNIIFFPMMFLSGTFFPREVFPDWLRPVSEYLPLSYLADGLRLVSNEAAGLVQLSPELLGMGVWTVIIYFISARVFRWE